ncbi:MAG: hypothetical protein K2F71_05655 [Paramuribaculum sp.]|nr:hypothetical protein [Paramuribaculum sp.]
MSNDKNKSYRNLIDTFKRFLTLKTEDLKLTLAEKATIVISTLVVSAVITLLAVSMFLFLTFAVAHWIAQSIGLTWAYFIIGGFYALLITLIIILRKQLIIDPVSRFISRVLLS